MNNFIDPVKKRQREIAVMPNRDKKLKLEHQIIKFLCNSDFILYDKSPKYPWVAYQISQKQTILIIITKFLMPGTLILFKLNLAHLKEIMIQNFKICI